MALQRETFTYSCEDTELQAHIAYDDTIDKPRPAVLICHDAMGGKSDFEHDRAQAIAELGYVGVAIDVYGDGVWASNGEEAYALMNPLLEDRELLRERLAAGLAMARERDCVDAGKLAAMGYCFGGCCVLEMARAGFDLRAVASFHGNLGADPGLATKPIVASVLAMHGWSDPLVPEQQVIDFTREMTQAGADWQLIAYGHALHSFTNPAANAPKMGIGYDEKTERRSWQALERHLAEAFGPG